MTLAHEAVGPDDGPVGWFLHGILGRGRNWRSFARHLADASGYRLVLPDLRCHGETPPLPGPHDLVACAGDLADLADELGAPDVIVGHSFGGKVALACLRAGLDPRVTWVLDAPPGRTEGRTVDPTVDPAAILAVLRAIPTPAANRDLLREPLRAAGIPETIVQWLLSSTAASDDGWRWLWDLDGVEQMMRSYAASDLWPIVDAAVDRGSEVHLVRAGRSDRWSDADLAALHRTRAQVHVLERAGHWLHVDDPEGLLALLRPSFGVR